MHHDPVVAIVVLNWNQRELTLQCLASLQAITYRNCRVIMVDNGSSDGTAEAVRSRFPAVTVLALRRNLGFAGGNNVGMRHALEGGAQMVLLLNNDTLVEPAFLDHLVERARSEPGAGMVAPKILYHGEPDRIWYAGGVISMWTGTMRHVGIREADGGRFDTPRTVDYATGCCLLVKHEVIERVGMLDESYRIYTEDADWSMRVRRAGYSILYEPGSRILHRVSVSSGGHLSWFKLRNKFVSNLRFFSRYAAWYHWLSFPWMNILVNAGAAFRYLLTARR